MSNEAKQTGKQLIQAERQRQIEKEGWTIKHDDEHNRGQLERAANCYFNFANYNNYSNTKVPKGWPWNANWWKPKNQLADYIRAGALYQAEMDRHNHKDSGASYWVNMKLMRIECENRIDRLLSDATPLPNDLEQAALMDSEDLGGDALAYFLTGFYRGHQHALSTVPDLIKKVLERAAENARAYNTVPRAYSDAAVDKQSILDTKFDDLINLKK